MNQRSENPRRRIAKMILGLLVAGLTFAPEQAPAQAQGYPNKVVKLLVPWAPGGTVDAVARLVAEHLGKQMHQTVIVENKSGANGSIGTSSVAHAEPDGYVFVVSNAETHTINPHIYKKLGYDVTSDFTAVTPLVKVPFVLVARNGLPASSVADVVALARSKPGKLTYASWGIGSVPQIGVLMLAQQEKIDLLHVPFNGGPPAFNAILAEQIDLMIMPAGIAAPMASSGKLKVLAAMGATRYAPLKDVRTLKEAGYDIELSSVVGLLAPAGTPQPIIRKVASEVAKLLDDPANQEALKRLGTEVFTLPSPREYATYLNDELDRWGKTIRAAGILIQ